MFSKSLITTVIKFNIYLLFILNWPDIDLKNSNYRELNEGESYFGHELGNSADIEQLMK